MASLRPTFTAFSCTFTFTLCAALSVGLPDAQAMAAKDRPSRAWLKKRVEEAKKLAERKIDPGTPAEDRWHDEAKALLDEMINWPQMTEDSLGTEWKKLTPKDQKEFSTLLRAMIESSYRSKLRLAARGELKKPTKVSIEWLESEGKGTEELVSARVKADKQEAVVSFKLHPMGERWRVIDVAIDDVSTVRTYRSQFRKLINQEGFPALLERMRKKIDDIKEGRAELGP